MYKIENGNYEGDTESMVLTVAAAAVSAVSHLIVAARTGPVGMRA